MAANDMNSSFLKSTNYKLIKFPFVLQKMGLAQAKDWMFTVANKLEEQHGIRRARKNSQKIEMTEVFIDSAILLLF